MARISSIRGACDALVCSASLRLQRQAATVTTCGNDRKARLHASQALTQRKKGKASPASSPFDSVQEEEFLRREDVDGTPAGQIDLSYLRETSINARQKRWLAYEGRTPEVQAVLEDAEAAWDKSLSCEQSQAGFLCCMQSLTLTRSR